MARKLDIVGFMQTLKSFRLPSFRINVRDLTDEETASNRNGIAEGRDYYAIDIFDKDGASLTLCVGGPIVMTQGKSWNETTAARSALSFASEASCFDDEQEIAWVEANGEDLINEAFNHRVLGTEMRAG